MRKLLWSVLLGGAALLGVASGARAAIPAAAPVITAGAPLLQTVQYFEDWRYREWRRHEEYERWRRHMEWRRWHEGYRSW